MMTKIKNLSIIIVFKNLKYKNLTKIKYKMKIIKKVLTPQSNYKKQILKMMITNPHKNKKVSK